jgi:hypothetical protein
MKESNLYLGLDVHGREIMAAVVEAEGAERFGGRSEQTVIATMPDLIRCLWSASIPCKSI